MHEKQQVADMASEDLARQARARAERTGETFEEELKASLKTEAGRQLRELRDGPHHDERADRWQDDLAKRAQERSRALKEERNRALQDAVWERFIQEELRDMELRKDGQLAGLLGEPLPGELPAQLGRCTTSARTSSPGRTPSQDRGREVADDVAQGAAR